MNNQKEIKLCYPRNTLPISITKDNCQLKCKHCNGQLLKGMRPLTGRQGEVEASSFLISGGCDSQGRVPVIEHWDEIKRLKKHGRTNIHLGLPCKETVSRISEIADVVSLDIIGSNETIKNVLGLEQSVRDYFKMFEALRKKIKVVPHLCIGIHGGEIRGEKIALKELASVGLEELTFLIFKPIKGSAFARKSPPQINHVDDIFTLARGLLPKTQINLGCMRPSGRYREEIDLLALETGVNCIVNPTPKARQKIEEMNWLVKHSWECCSL